MADLLRDFWVRETGTCQHVFQLHVIYDDDDDDDDDDSSLLLVIYIILGTCTNTKTG